MAKIKIYDLICIGGGSAGFNAARIAADLGKKVAVIDGAKQLGGLCILRGCMPSKTLIASSDAARGVREAEGLGIVTESTRVDFAPLTSDTRIQAVMSGKVDLECGSTTSNLQRQKEVAFSPTFFVAGTTLVWAPSIPVALVVLSIAQMGVHLVFFLHITSGPDNVNNAMALAFGVLIVLLLLAGSLWIMAHLNQNMMPMDQIMQMQR